MIIRMRSEKGVSGAISAMFVIAIFFVILLTTFAITGLMNSYNQVVNERSEMDWDRNSEHIRFIEAAVGTDKILGVSFSNDGRVTLRIVQVWLSEFSDDSYASSTYQHQFSISRYVSSGETINDLGFLPEFKRVNSADLTSLSGLNNQYYKIKLVTERGNVFECQVPYPPSSDGGQNAGYVLQIDNNMNNFQYATDGMSQWADAYSHPAVADKKNVVIYRILILNTADEAIVLLYNTTMIQFATPSGGGTSGSTQWFICKPNLNLPISNYYSTDYTPSHYQLNWGGCTPTSPDTTQTIAAGSSDYVYFALMPDSTGPPPNGPNSYPIDAWQNDPGGGQYYLVDCILSFHFQSAPGVYRSVPTPVIVQYLK